MLENGLNRQAQCREREHLVPSPGTPGEGAFSEQTGGIHRLIENAELFLLRS